MSRSIRKGPFVDVKLMQKVLRMKQQSMHEPIKTWCRACMIVPEFVGQTFMVHNGKTFIRTYVTENMVGHRLGEFAPTRTFRGHAGKKAAGGT
ncbi:MAG TPA: 30S ribosomal protein S19 [Planctomycetota bacterium]|nr:30S ribosomal protein S19 [Planctomycetota bacterium]HUW30621.1 30S ribosomal protein S19 [Planctomycetota bacterium]